ncbi:MAG TPA: O-antigen ligase family protein [Bacillales bacterium]|nr:O-antigen ligase family protein [Bacillales bacterium]
MKTSQPYSLEWGILLLFLLPPVGIGWMILKGWYHFYQVLSKKGTFPVTPAVIFFCSLMVSSVGAAILLQNGKFLLITGMLIGYCGIYFYAKDKIQLSDLRRYKWIVIFGGVYIFLFGNIQLYIHQHWHVNHPIIGFLTGAKLLGFPQYDRLLGDAYNPNFASFLLLLAAAFLLTELLAECKKGPRLKPLLFKLALLAAIGTAVVQTESREGFVTLMILLLLFVFRYRWKIGLFLLGVGLLFHDQWMAIIPRTDIISHSWNFRERIWENSVQIWNNHPLFGVTPFGFQHEYDLMTGRSIAHAHNIFLAYLSDYGILGELAFLLLIVTFLYKFVRVLTSMKNDSPKIIDLFLLAFPIVPLTGMLDFPMASPQVMFLVIILLGSWDNYAARFHFQTKRAALQVRYT